MIHRGGILLRLAPSTICTAIAYFHRCSEDKDERPHLLVHEKYSHAILSSTCLFLAAKVAEDPRRLREIITTRFRLLHPGAEFPKLNKKYHADKDDLVACEQLVLRTLRFELEYDDRHKILLHFLKWLDLKKKDPKLAQVAYGLMTDATYSPYLCHKRAKRALAAACIVVAADLLKRDPEDVFPAGILPWYGALGAHPGDVANMCHHLLQLIKQMWGLRKQFKDEEEVLAV